MNTLFSPPYEYCIDTSSLTEFQRGTYPLDIFPGLWKDFQKSFTNEKITSPQEVYDELTYSDDEDELALWAKKNKELFLQVNEEQILEVRDIIQNYPRAVDYSRSRSTDADVWVVAVAKVLGLTVVTQEKAGGMQGKFMKIPQICTKIGVPCIDLLELIKREKWAH